MLTFILKRMSTTVNTEFAKIEINGANDEIQKEKKLNYQYIVLFFFKDTSNPISVSFFA